MRFLLGFASGVAAAWAALSIWQRVPPLGLVDAVDESRPVFDDSVARVSGGYVVDPRRSHDAYCLYPMRPCVCAVMNPTSGGIGAP